MASPNSIISILFIALVAVGPTYGFELLNSECLIPTSAGFTSAGFIQFNTNVKTLLKFLTSKSTLAKTGFSSGSAGQPDTQRAYGLINCRADISSSDCKACAHQATKDVVRLCSVSHGAVIWYDSCTLKYSDSDFVGTVDTDFRFARWSWTRSSDPEAFGSRVKGMLSKLSEKAVNDPKLFALGKTKADSNTTVYGMVACTRDLSGADCGACLRAVVGEFSLCCNDVEGGREVAASCMFRFEVYPF